MIIDRAKPTKRDLAGSWQEVSPRERHTIVRVDAPGDPQGRSPSEFKYAQIKAKKESVNLNDVCAVSSETTDSFFR